MGTFSDSAASRLIKHWRLSIEAPCRIISFQCQTMVYSNEELSHSSPSSTSASIHERVCWKFQWPRWLPCPQSTPMSVSHGSGSSSCHMAMTDRRSAVNCLHVELVGLTPAPMSHETLRGSHGMHKTFQRGTTKNSNSLYAKYIHLSM